ncbi:MAG: AAA family ATPase [Planctomycetes bacterium]|nr:AAA family ATPase [Planctomycetota bacterium]
MLTSFSAKTFRCFRDLSLCPLARVNLITGANNCGKTALLEALFLHVAPTNPEVAVRLCGFRGFPTSPKGLEEAWTWFFFRRRVSEAAALSSTGADGVKRALRLSLQSIETAEVGTGDVSTMLPMEGHSRPVMAGLRQLVLEYKDSDRTVTSTVTLSEDLRVVKLERAGVQPFAESVFLTPRHRNLQEDAERFSDYLERVGRESELVDVLRILEPRIKRVVVLASGGMHFLGADAGLGEVIPLSFLGDGLVRLACIALAIASASGGLVLIDEVENGLYHSAMSRVWQAIGEAARRQNVQVFATTHSLECIRAAYEAFSQMGPDEFRLFRLDRNKDDVSAVVYDAETVEAALVHGIEVR